ncbi:Protein of unknown function [Pseudorhodobacter antarcticus]|uniref:DUF3445 domain-containing protein n=2 Tax=Pseudorhodobacter antarcticus TaxID=1077947 RepID=A0A1H8D8M0_9RHOB|nr:Protein of unknown function [Pseudorhodobacter antarcticus]
MGLAYLALSRQIMGMNAILNHTLPALPWMEPALARLPGMRPVLDDAWTVQTETFAAQMAARDRLIADAAPVHALLPAGQAAAEEVYALMLARLRGTPGYAVTDASVTRPDGVGVPLRPDAPPQTLGRLVQEDVCLLTPGGMGEHTLSGAILCFPASWTLAEKLGRPMTAIHTPVRAYDGDMARRVQRLLDGVRVGQPLWRMNHNLYASADLFHPRPEAAPRLDAVPLYLRAERQCLLRLPQTGAIVFTIHTYLMRLADLGVGARAALFVAHGVAQ